MRVARIEPCGTADVYNMETDTHDFAINGGFIVHNCDALRYFCVMRHRPTDPLPEKRRPNMFYDMYGAKETDGEPSESYIYMKVTGRR